MTGRSTKGKRKTHGKVIAKEEDSDIFKVVKMLMEHQYDPVRLKPQPTAKDAETGCAVLID